MIRTNNREFKSHPDLLFCLWSTQLRFMCLMLSYQLILSYQLYEVSKKHRCPFYRYETEALIFPRGSFPAPYSFFGHTVGHVRSYFPDQGQNPPPRHPNPSLEAWSLNHWTAREVRHFSRKLASENIKRAEPDSI